LALERPHDSRTSLEGLVIAVAGHFPDCSWLCPGRLLVAFISTSDNQVFLDLGADWRVLAFTTSLAVELPSSSASLLPSAPLARAAALLHPEAAAPPEARERFSLRAILASRSCFSMSSWLVLSSSPQSRNLTTLNTGFLHWNSRHNVDLIILPAGRPFPRFNLELCVACVAVPGVESAAVGLMLPFGAKPGMTT